MMQTNTSLKPVTRRKFLRMIGIGVGASTLACCGLTYAATQSPRPSQITQAETPSYTYGKDLTMNKRILVTYATRTGSTVGVASAIGETLASRGYHVDVKPMKDNPSLEGYQAVIIGSAVNGGQWLPEAVTFVKDHQQALKQVPVALFCVHGINMGDDERSRKWRYGYLDAIRPLVSATHEAWFGGKGLDPAETNGIVRWIARTFVSAGEGDLRDWAKIRGWAQALSL